MRAAAVAGLLAASLAGGALALRAHGNGIAILHAAAPGQIVAPAGTVARQSATTAAPAASAAPPGPMPPGPMPPGPPPGPAPPGPATRGQGTESLLVLHRPGSDTPRRVRMWRPAVPDSAALPVVYLLHGVPGTPDDPFDEGLSQLMNAWVSEGGAPFVVAVPDGGGDGHDDTEWADAADGSDQVETFLLQTVLPAVEGTHPRAAAQRAVAGFSMGGYGAVDISLRHPGTFSSVVSLAGYMHVDDPDGMFAGRPAVETAHEPASMVAAGTGMRFFLADADGEDEPVVQGETQAFARQLQAAHLPVQSEITSGDHSWHWAMSEWPHVQAWLGAVWAR